MAIVILLLIAIIAMMLIGWRARKRRQSGIDALPPLPRQLGEPRAELDGLYLATTVADEPMNRIAVRGLGFRAGASITVTDTGIAIALDGGVEFFIPAADLRDVRSARLTIDRVVEEGGLVLIAWRLGTAVVDSYFRVDATRALITAVLAIVPEYSGEKK
ncbi:MAG: hypothetical protein QOI02_1890 [Actinomycetota bacterium]|jgi:hypothetical protein|nr:hypothetical protein [Glaciihabitans sp.]MDQ1556888.1 hypothetical protein [Actinomycetota bacterium]